MNYWRSGAVPLQPLFVSVSLFLLSVAQPRCRYPLPASFMCSDTVTVVAKDQTAGPFMAEVLFNSVLLPAVAFWSSRFLCLLLPGELHFLHVYPGPVSV